MPLSGFKRWISLGAVAWAGALAGGCQHYTDQPLTPGQTATQLLDRSLSSPDLRDFLKQNLGHDLPEWPLKTWDFETLNWAAFYYNPSLQVARLQWAGAQGAILTGAERPNPSITLTPGYDFNPAAGTISPWLPGLTVDVPVETAGKRAKRMKQAEWLSEATRQNIFAAAWQVRADLRQALIEWDAAGRRASAAAQAVGLEQQVLNRLQQRVDAGALAAGEMSTARLALVKAQSDAGNAARGLGVARARIAEVIGVPVSALEGIELSAAQVATGKTFSASDLAAARAVSLQTRADILSAMANYEASQSALQLEIAKQYPDIHLGSGYQYDLGENKWSLSFGVDLPIFNQNQGPIAEAAAARQTAAAQIIAVQAHVIAQIDAAAAANAAAAGLMEDLGRQNAEMQKRLEQVNSQISAGAGDPLDQLTAQIDLSAGNLALMDAQAQAAAASGQLEDALQVPLANLPAVQNDPRAPTAKSASP
jgi:outer membrane protein TolC